jgi:hypothetical protein
MKSVIIASLIASAAAFAPAQQSARTSVATNMAFEDELGVQAPLGFFDPLGLLSSGDEATFNRLRYVEIKHGRVAQLAFLGYLVTAAGVRLPGNINLSGTKFADIPDGFPALAAIGGAGIAQIVGYVGMLELLWVQDPDSFPGVSCHTHLRSSLRSCWTSLTSLCLSRRHSGLWWVHGPRWIPR